MIVGGTRTSAQLRRLNASCIYAEEIEHIARRRILGEDV